MNAAIVESGRVIEQKTTLISSARFVYLDTIRGFAALVVVVCHYISVYQISADDIWQYSPLSIVFNGKAAVSMFFVLSGFVLTIKYLHKDKSGIVPEMNYLSYIIARVCRIWIPFAVVLFLSALAQKTIFPGHAVGPIQDAWDTQLWSNELNAFDVIKQSLFKHQGMDKQLMPQDWTLRLEIMLSLMIPVAVLIARRSTLWLIGITIYTIVAFHISFYALHFMMGIMLSKHYKQIIGVLRNGKALKIFLFSIGLLLLTFKYSVAHYIDFNNNNAIDVLSGIGSALLLIFVSSSKTTQSALNHPCLAYIGTVSYSVYLCHFIVQLSITPLILNEITDFNSWWIYGLIAQIIITLALSAALYRYVEVPSIALGKKINAYIKYCS
jgi:peptidoglycan/LPS O-acetylase OafA/YrhL